MSEALWGFFGVIVGALASSGTTLWVTRMASQNREAEAAAERLRAALYGLQDELTGFTRVCAALLLNPKDGASGAESVVQLDRIQRFASRCGDQDLYAIYRGIRSGWFSGPEPVTQYQAWRDHLNDIFDGPVSDMHNRIAVLLQDPAALIPLTLSPDEAHQTSANAIPVAIPVRKDMFWDRIRPNGFR